MIFYSARTYDIFLSHSYLDKPLVYALVDIFNDAGYSVYVDWIADRQLDRDSVNKDTAETLRARMASCRCLAYVTTSNIANSKWCPWELGYMDGKKNGRCAILPVVEAGGSVFSGQEYLGLYPYIDYEVTNGHRVFWVTAPQDQSKYVRLDDWISGRDPG